MFHLSISENSLDKAISFYEMLGGKVSHRDNSGYVNILLHGCQLTLHESKAVEPVTLHNSSQAAIGVEYIPLQWLFHL